jgi:hypothetical protein
MRLIENHFEMEEFNQEVWNSWLVSGFKFIRYRRIGGHSIALKPIMRIDPKDEFNSDFTYLGILDEEVGEMALNEIPLLKNFNFYVEEWD